MKLRDIFVIALYILVVSIVVWIHFHEKDNPCKQRLYEVDVYYGNELYTLNQMLNTCKEKLNDERRKHQEQQRKVQQDQRETTENKR